MFPLTRGSILVPVFCATAMWKATSVILVPNCTKNSLKVSPLSTESGPKLLNPPLRVSLFRSRTHSNCFLLNFPFFKHPQKTVGSRSTTGHPHVQLNHGGARLRTRHAPSPGKQRTTSWWPLRVAQCRGVLPSWSATSLSAPHRLRMTLGLQSPARRPKAWLPWESRSVFRRIGGLVRSSHLRGARVQVQIQATRGLPHQPGLKVELGKLKAPATVARTWNKKVIAFKDLDGQKVDSLLAMNPLLVFVSKGHVHQTI